MKRVLIVDDERDIREALTGVFTDEGYEVVTAATAEEALEVMNTSRPDLVLLDIWLPGMDGIEALKRMRGAYPDVQVVMISGHATIETAVRATKLGAYDFIEKPVSLDKVLLTAEHALEKKRLADENRRLRESALARYELIGRSKVMESLRADIRRVAPTDSWVLITGENGTGKEFVARNIHLLSARAGGPFVEVNCAAIPEELIESELFGHEKGAFTSAVARKKGKFDLAHRGTIFLDEIGDMSLKTQAKILRILQEQGFERVGGTERINVDVRVLAATNKDLMEEIKKGRFREDLYYRLNVIPFHVPALRERGDDVILLAEHFLREFSRQTAREEKRLERGAREALMRYRWPGNVRELKNLMERLVIMTHGEVITVDDLPPYMRGGDGATYPEGLFRNTLLKEARKDFEREFILRKLRDNDWNISRTAEVIGIERSHLYRKIRSYGLEPDAGRSGTD